MLDRFSDSGRRTIILAQERAREFGHRHVGTEHLLLALLIERDGLGAQALRSLSMSEADVQRVIEEHIGTRSSMATGHIPFTPRVKTVFELAAEEVTDRRPLIATEHLLLGIVEEGNGVAVQLFRKLGRSGADIARRVRDMMASEDDPRYLGELQPPPLVGHRPVKPSLLDQFGQNLTEMARRGELDPVVGRGHETERIIQILSRRSKHNPVLVGEPGVGKTAIVDGLAQRIAVGAVPVSLQAQQLYSLDMGALIAGSRYRGDFEDRLQNLVKEAVDRGDVIVFIDEIHTMVGIGATEGALDAGTIFKPVLARGKLRVIGATTPVEFRKYIERDAALARRLQPVTVDPPTTEETMEVLETFRPLFERHHGVRISDQALAAAIELSNRYLTERCLPDKALDLIDEACARLQIRLAGEPLPSPATPVPAATSITGQLTIDDVAKVLSIWTGIPLGTLTAYETERLVVMEGYLGERVVGQSQAVEAVAQTIRRSRAGLDEANRPVGSFIFLGPTGVGKTELAKALAEFLFGDDDRALIIADMSDYMERHAVSRLVGSPPGYIGHEDGGFLTDAVHQHPYSVVLLDEIEKAHPDVFNIFLQVLDEGRLTDGQGRVVDFSNTIVIMTSNLGSDLRQETTGFVGSGAKPGARAAERTREALRSHFRPEFLNRIDEIVVFDPLSDDDMELIVEQFVARLGARLDRRDITIRLSPAARSHLARIGHDPEMGARPLHRILRREIETRLSDHILAGTIRSGGVFAIDLADLEGHERLAFSVEAGGEDTNGDGIIGHDRGSGQLPSEARPDST